MNRRMPKLSVIVCSSSEIKYDEFIGNFIRNMKDDDKYDIEFVFELDIKNKIKFYNSVVGRVSANKILFIDDDCVPGIGFYEKLLDYLDKYPLVGVMGSDWISTHYPLVTVVEEDRIFGGASDLKFKPAPARCVCLEGEFIGVRKEVVDKIKWDETLGEFADVDFTLRAHLQGFEVWVVPIDVMFSIDFRALNEELNSDAILFSRKWGAVPYYELKRGC